MTRQEIISKDEQERLHRQRSILREYADVLAERIAAFK